MFAVVITEKGGAQRRVEFDKSEVTIGRVQGNDVILPKGNVSKRHSRIVLKDGRFIVVDLKSTNGTYVNGRKITSPLVVKPGDKVYIGDFILTVEEGPLADGSSPPVPEPARLPAPAPAPRPAPAPSVRPAPPQAAPPQAAPPQAAPRAPAPSPSPLRPPAPAATSEGGLAAIMGRLGARFALTDTSAAGLDDTARWAQAKQLIDQIMGELVAEGSLDAPQDALAAQALREAVGLGALESVLARAGVRELVVEGPETVLVDEGQGLAETDLSVSSSAMLTILARRLAARGGATDLERPVLKGFLPEGGQVTVVQAPLAVGGPFIEVRRQAQGPRLEGLVDQGMLDIEMADLLEAAVESRRNVVVLGPSGSAVTTLLGALASRAKAEERMVVVAPTPDVAVRRDHVLRLSVGDGPFASVLREALQLRADRLVVDGVGAGDGHGALLALATRGEGVLMGVHAAADDDATASLRLQAKLGGLADDAARALVARSVDLVVQVSVTAAGPRVMRITEIGGDNGELRALDLYRWTGTAFERLTR